MKLPLFTFLLLLSIFPSCSNKCKELQSPASTYHINVGDKIEFQTSASRDAAMDWFWKNSSNDHLKKIDEKESVCGKGMNNMGTTIRTFVFEGTHSGNDSIVMHEKHVFEADTVVPYSKQVIYVHVH